MNAFALQVIRRLIAWWLALTVPAIVFVGFLGTRGESIDLFSVPAFELYALSLVFGAMWAFPLEVVATTIHTGALYRHLVPK